MEIEQRRSKGEWWSDDEDNGGAFSLGFSKKLTNLRAVVALHVFHYNFFCIHRSPKGTPAMATGVTDRLWTLNDLFG